MKLAIVADTHFRFTRPRYRKDPDYIAMQLRKWEFILKTTVKHDKILLHGGDLFDAFDVPYEIYHKVASLTEQIKQERDLQIICVLGQHDMAHHHGRVNNPAAAMASRNLIDITDEHPISIQDCRIYGCGWKEDIPAIKTPDNFNILIMHKLILYKDNPDFKWEEGIPLVKNIVKESAHDLFVTGDNHKTFTYANMLVNAGSMVRQKIDQFDHKPCIFIYDVKQAKITDQIFIPIAPIEEVFDLDSLALKEQLKKDEEEFSVEELAKELSKARESDGSDGLDFRENMIATLNEKPQDKDVEIEIWEAIPDGKNNR